MKCTNDRSPKQVRRPTTKVLVIHHGDGRVELRGIRASVTAHVIHTPKTGSSIEADLTGEKILAELVRAKGVPKWCSRLLWPDCVIARSTPDGRSISQWIASEFDACIAQLLKRFDRSEIRKAAG